MLSEPRDYLINSKRNSIPTQGKVLRNRLRANYRLHCERWGKKFSHTRLKCLAKEATCHKCSKKGHRVSFCKSWKVGEIEEDSAFLGEIGTETAENFWSAELFVINNPIHFKIDTRAVVTVIPESIYENTMPAPDLLRPTKTLFGPDRTALPVRGCFTRTITRGQETLPQEIFVVAGARRALLGRTAIETLGVFQRVNAVDAEEIKCKFSKFFKTVVPIVYINSTNKI